MVVDGHEAKMTIGLLQRGGRGVEPAPAAESAAEPGEATESFHACVCAAAVSG
ncbi:MAG: hypothetical protein QM756_13635 [Polyangiaceae bacterium]